jgi:hypothetical protein
MYLVGRPPNALRKAQADVAEGIGNLANYDIQRCLDLTRDVVTSSHIKAEELLKAYIAGSAMLVDSEDVKKALIRGRASLQGKCGLLRPALRA